MTILQVLYVLEIARCGSVSRAAEHLFVSQPALSLQVRRLENELGCELFHREPQGVCLTAAGQVFCEEAQTVETSWRRLQERTRLLSNAVCHKVRIGIGSRALSSGVFELTAAFFNCHPETEVTYLLDIGDQVTQALEERRMDLAIDRLPPEEIEPRREHIIAFELLRERQCVLLSPQDPRSGLLELSFPDLNGSDLVSGPEGSLDDLIMKRACQTFGIEMARVQRADNLEAVMALIRCGKGIALGPESFAVRYHVAAVPMLPPTDVALNLLCLKQNAKNPLVQQLRRYLVSESSKSLFIR